jgi:hypothetical protein
MIRCFRQINFPVCRNFFPVHLHREFQSQVIDSSNYLNLAFTPTPPKTRDSLFFSLLAGNLAGGDRFCRTASTTRKSARAPVVPAVQDIDAISGVFSEPSFKEASRFARGGGRLARKWRVRQQLMVLQNVPSRASACRLGRGQRQAAEWTTS